MIIAQTYVCSSKTYENRRAGTCRVRSKSHGRTADVQNALFGQSERKQNCTNRIINSVWTALTVHGSPPNCECIPKKTFSHLNRERVKFRHELCETSTGLNKLAVFP